MPLYEYQCESCAHRFERIQKFSDPPIETCPSCGGPVKKLLSSPAIQFKGSGFYITDYAKKSAKSAGEGQVIRHAGRRIRVDSEQEQARRSSRQGLRQESTQRRRRTERSTAWG